jgi:hypothetical protein
MRATPGTPYSLRRVLRTSEGGTRGLQLPPVLADLDRMRLSVMVLGVLCVVLEIVGHHLETVGWDRVTPLHVISALVDALLVLVIAIAAVVVWDILRRRWGPALRAWQERQLQPEPARETIGVTSWRAGQEPFPPPRTLGAPRRPPTYGGGGTGRRYPEDPGRLL